MTTTGPASGPTSGPTSGLRPMARLPRRTLAGYSLGSLVTGAFGTVPGLLLLPYLTDTLGVAAGVSGLLVLLPGFPTAVAPGGRNAAPPALREALLTGFLGLLQRPAPATE